MRWSAILTDYSTFFLSHDKKDRFTEFGKSSQKERFVFLWGIIPPFARNPHTSILCITLKTIKMKSIINKPPPQIRLNVLIACEESQTSCLAFRQLGHNAYSCDLQPCSGGHPEWHIQDDVLKHINEEWDLIIAHPPCTYMCQGSSIRMFPNCKLDPLRLQKAQEAKAFFMKFYNSKCPHVAIENPRPLKIVGLPWSTQVIEPWQFGEPWSKETHLWLKDLPLLRPTQIVTHHKCFTSAKWDAKSRSKTFAGIAAAWAEQWSRFILESDYS